LEPADCVAGGTSVTEVQFLGPVELTATIKLSSIASSVAKMGLHSVCRTRCGSLTRPVYGFCSDIAENGCCVLAANFSMASISRFGPAISCHLSNVSWGRQLPARRRVAASLALFPCAELGPA